MNLSPLIIAVFLSLPLALSAVSHAATAVPAAPRALFEKYCTDCHDDATA